MVKNKSNAKAKTSPAKGKRKSSYIPRPHIEICDLAKDVSSKWNSSPLTLLWITSAEFATLVQNLEQSLNDTTMAGYERSPLTGDLKNLDKEMDKSLMYVKGYLTEMFGKDNALSHYEQFGIKKMYHTYKFPKDRNERVEALKKMIYALSNYNIQGNYSTAYWTDILNQYEPKVKQASDIDGDVAEKVEIKKALVKQTVKTLRAIVGLIKVNYPDSYKHELISWGFQRDKH